jgi:hypothetical protein
VRRISLLAGMVALAITPAGAAAHPAPPPLRDTVTASGQHFVIDDFSSYAIDVDAFSGPAGGSPGGRVSFEAGVVRLPISGPVSCLKVTANMAIIRIEGPFPAAPGWLGMMIRVVDNGGAGLDRFDYFPVLPEIEPTLDCETGAPAWFGGLLDGRAIVTDATLDPDPPETTITAVSTTAAGVRFDFTSDEPGSSFQCKVDRGPFKPCRSPRTVTHQVQGVHRFKVRAIDRAGNVDPSPATHRFTIGP